MPNHKNFLLPLPNTSCIPRAPSIPLSARTLLLICIALYVPTLTIFSWVSFSSSSSSSLSGVAGWRSHESSTRLKDSGSGSSGVEVKEGGNVEVKEGGSVKVKGSGSRINEGVYNETLGFEEIFYISLPQRQDRQDIMELLASFTGMKFTMVPGVNGSSIHAKAKPYPPNSPYAPRDPEVGCWRAHANVWKLVLEKDLETALIFEDDIDFSTGFRSIMSNVSLHLTELTSKYLKLTHPSYTPPPSSTEEIYGLGNTIPPSKDQPAEPAWDVLSLGHCWNQMPEPAKHPIHASLNIAWIDPYAPEDEREFYTPYLPPQTTPGNTTPRVRALRPTYSVVCTQAYAVTKRGAQRLLHNIGGPGGDLYAPVDLVMDELFKQGRVRGFTVVPSMFNPWKYDNYKDSDLDHDGFETYKAEKGSGRDTVDSVRVEMEKVLKDRKNWSVDKEALEGKGKGDEKKEKGDEKKGDEKKGDEKKEGEKKEGEKKEDEKKDGH